MINAVQKVSQYDAAKLPLRLIFVKMKYFRSYPWGLQLLLFFLMVVTMMGFGSFMLLTLLPKLSPYTVEQLSKLDQSSPMNLISTSLTVQGILSVFVFLIPAWLFAHLTHPEPRKYLGLKAPGRYYQLLLAVLLMLGAMPVLQMMEGLFSQINFSAKIKADQAASENVMNAFLTIPDFTAFVRAFFILAVLPAVGEEMFFRGVLLRLAKKRSRTMLFPIIFTAVVFSYSHTNIYGFVPICLAGVLLAVIYNLTGSLWCSIAAHMFFNGFQVILSYLGNSNAAVKAFMSNTSVPYYFVIGGAVLFGISLYLLIKTKTPLPGNWTDDFPPDSPQEGEWDFIKKDR